VSDVIFVTGWTEWKYRNDILFLSSSHDLTNVISVTRKERDGMSENISCPQIVKQYNADMGFVDKADKL
jgi:hypothetical protein